MIVKKKHSIILERIIRSIVVEEMASFAKKQIKIIEREQAENAALAKQTKEENDNV